MNAGNTDDCMVKGILDMETLQRPMPFQAQEMEIWQFLPVLQIADMAILIFPQEALNDLLVGGFFFGKPRSGKAFLELQASRKHQTVDQRAEPDV